MSLRKVFDLIDFEGSHSPNSIMIYLYSQEIKQRWQETFTDEQETPVKIQM